MGPLVFPKNFEKEKKIMTFDWPFEFDHLVTTHLCTAEQRLDEVAIGLALVADADELVA